MVVFFGKTALTYAYKSKLANVELIKFLQKKMIKKKQQQKNNKKRDKKTGTKRKK